MTEDEESLRDWFAGNATHDDAMRHMEYGNEMRPGKDYPPPLLTIEQAKYRYADAMLKAREEQ